MNKDLFSAGQRSARAGAPAWWSKGLGETTSRPASSAEDIALLALALFISRQVPIETTIYSQRGHTWWTMDEQNGPEYQKGIEMTPDYSTEVRRRLTTTKLTH